MAASRDRRSILVRSDVDREGGEKEQKDCAHVGLAATLHCGADASPKRTSSIYARAERYTCTHARHGRRKGKLVNLLGTPCMIQLVHRFLLRNSV